MLLASVLAWVLVRFGTTTFPVTVRAIVSNRELNAGGGVYCQQSAVSSHTAAVSYTYVFVRIARSRRQIFHCNNSRTQLYGCLTHLVQWATTPFVANYYLSKAFREVSAQTILLCHVSMRARCTIPARVLCVL